MVKSKNSDPSESDPSGPPASSEPPASNEMPGAAMAATAAPSFVNRHRLGVGIGAAALAVVLVSGLTAWGVSAAVAASSPTASSATVPPVASVPPTPAAGEGAAQRGAVVRGTIEGITGSTWTITTVAGATKQVTIGTATHYGTKKVPAVASDFTVGTAVLVTEKSSGDGETAVRVVMAKQGASAQTAAPTAAPTTTS